MTNIGIIRRIDELGRVVIPKEIRNTLRIKSGDCLEVFSDGEMIKIKKKDFFSDTYKVMESILIIICQISSADVLLTDLDSILFKNGKNFSIADETKISNNIYNQIKSGKEHIYNSVSEFNYDKINYILKPLIINGDIIGSIILLKNKKSIDELDKNNIEIISELIINYLEV